MIMSASPWIRNTRADSYFCETGCIANELELGLMELCKKARLLGANAVVSVAITVDSEGDPRWRFAGVPAVLRDLDTGRRLESSDGIELW